MGVAARILDAQRGALFPWLPVAYGAGIALYFALRAEPGPVDWGAHVGLLALLTAALFRWGTASVLLVAVWAAAAGFGVAGLRAAHVAEPVLTFRYYGPIEGRIVGIDRSASDAVRLTLDRVVLRDVGPATLPSRVRVSLHGDQRHFTPEPGATIILTGHLSPPAGPVEPGGFDFRRQAWFQGLGAVGYTRTPVLVFAPPEPGGVRLAIFALRRAIGEEVARLMPGRSGPRTLRISLRSRGCIWGF